MAIDENLLQKARDNPEDIWFDDAVKLAKQLGWVESRKRGSHVVFYHPRGQLLRAKYPMPLNLQQGKNGKAKSYQIRQMLQMAKEMGIV